MVRVVPVETRRGDRGVRQPVERDVIEHVVLRQTLRSGRRKTRAIISWLRTSWSIIQAARPTGESTIPYSVCGRLFISMRVAEPVLVEEVELVPRMLFVGRESGRRRARRPRAPSRLGRNGGRHVGMDTEQSRRLLQRHQLRDGIAPVAALRDVFRVPKALHQRRPSLRDADGIPSGRRRFAGEAVARQRRDHEMEGIRRGRAMCASDWSAAR